MLTLSSHLRRLSFLLVLATKIQDIPDIIKRFVKFLKEEPEENFKSTPFEEGSEILCSNAEKFLPFTLNEKALKNIKKIMAPYPSVISAGILPGTPTMNFLYILGQFLTNITLVLESKFGDESWLKELFKVWGAREKMNARALVDEYSGKDPSTVKRDLIKKLNESSKIIAEPLNQ